MIDRPPDPLAPRTVVDLPRYWDLRRLAHGKPDASTCAADLRQALIAERRRGPGFSLLQVVVIASGLFVTSWSAVTIWANHEPTSMPLCPECPCEEQSE